MKIFEWKKLTEREQQYYLLRSEEDTEAVLTTVRPIIDDVKKRGDAALREYALRFDKADIGNLPIQVTKSEFSAAENLLSDDVKKALDYAIANVQTFHRQQLRQDTKAIEIRTGISVEERYSPIESVGLYVPHGRGSFPSMLYMLAVPAVLAGVPHLAIATPPQPDGSIDAACLYAAGLCGVDRVYRIGGSQAIAALAFGTETVTPVQKIVGPGSSYVNAAKRLLSSHIDPGLPAGPSESIIVADAQANPDLITLDLFIEAEHGSDSSAILITDNPQLAREVQKRAAEYLREIPEPRQGFVRDVFKGYGCILLTDSIEEALELVNRFAPEHLQIQTATPRKHCALVRNAGEILLGEHAPFTLANYAVGANAVLPTGGRAKTWSAVSVRDFMKAHSVIEIDTAGYAELKQHCQVLAEYEGFFTHHQALARRSEKA